MLGLALEAGHEVVNDENQADLIIVNTCAFIQDARDESASEINHVCSLKEHDPAKKIIVAGCLSQKEKKNLFKLFPNIDAIIGVNETTKINQVIQSITKTPQRKVKSAKPKSKSQQPNAPRLLATPPYMAYLRISDGCDKKCTYCVIPSLRGPYHSRPMGEIVQEAKLLASKGVKELILIAQDTMGYGIDLYQRHALPELLGKLEQVPGIHWIRILYAYPDGISKDLVQIMASSGKICHYLDMPLQHSDSSVLRRMGRPHRVEHTRRLIDQLRAAMPNIALRTTFIVGFPGETDEHFENLCRFIEEVKFDRVGVFEYSLEPGTPAALLAGQVEPKVKQERQSQVRAIQAEISQMKNKQLIGQTLEVLFAGNAGGRSFRDAPEIDGQVLCTNQLEPGAFANVKVTHAFTHDLKGKLADTG